MTCWVVVVPFVALWSLANPLMAAPDESANVFEAAAAVRLEFNTPLVAIPVLGKENQIVLPPSLVRLGHISDCLVNPVNSAHCEHPAATTSNITTTQFGRYPQLYYLIVGWPTLFSKAQLGVYGVRLVAAFWCSGLIALGIWELLTFASGRRWLMGIFVSLTPAFAYWCSVANNSGFEISASFAMWCGLLTLATRKDLPKSLLWTSAISTGLLIQTRPISPILAATIVGTSAVLAGRSRAKEIIASGSARGPLVIVAISIAAAGVWDVSVGGPPLLGVKPPAHSTLGALRMIFHLEANRVQSLVGNLLGVLEPRPLFLLWVAMLGTVVIVVWKSTLLRTKLVALGLVAFIFAIATAFEIHYFSEVGAWWQARYGMPLLIGVPLVLTLGPLKAVRVRQIPSFIYTTFSASFVVLQFGTLAWAIHRYANGINGPWRIARQSWQPPGGIVILLGLSVTLTAAIVILLAVLTTPLGTTPKRPDQDPDLDLVEMGSPNAELPAWD